MRHSKLFVLLVVGVIAALVAAAFVLRERMRCAGFAGPAPAAAELPADGAPPARLRVVTWNIRNFPLDERPQYPDLGFSRRTNICDLEAVLAGFDADLVGLAEICDTRRFPPILRRALPERAYRVLFAADGGRFGQHVGVAWDSRRLEVVGEPVELAGVAVERGLRPAFALHLRSTAPGGADLTVVQVHLAAAPTGYATRLRQYRELARAVDGLVARFGDEDVMVVGDFNTTGPEGGSPEDELEVADAILGEAGLGRMAMSLPCTEYWEGPVTDGVQIPALLDLVYLRSLAEVDRSRPAEVWLHCRRERCRDLVSRAGAEDATFWDVSDHCPLSFELDDRDLD